MCVGRDREKQNLRDHNSKKQWLHANSVNERTNNDLAEGGHGIDDGQQEAKRGGVGGDLCKPLPHKFCIPVGGEVKEQGT